MSWIGHSEELSGTLGFSICSSHSVNDCQGRTGSVRGCQSLSGTLNTIFYFFFSSCNLLSSLYCCLILWQISNKVGNFLNSNNLRNIQVILREWNARNWGISWLDYQVYSWIKGPSYISAVFPGFCFNLKNVQYSPNCGLYDNSKIL